MLRICTSLCVGNIQQIQWGGQACFHAPPVPILPTSQWGDRKGWSPSSVPKTCLSLDMRLQPLLVSAAPLGEQVALEKEWEDPTLRDRKTTLRLLHAGADEAPVLHCFKGFFPLSTETFGKLDNFMDILVWSKKLNLTKNTFLKKWTLGHPTCV